MALYKLDPHELTSVPSRSMSYLEIRERGDLQRLLKEQIDVVSRGTLVISEEFTGWVGSKRRIDLLGIDPDGTLVVFELKRTEDGGHMDLQAIRYAAMVSLFSFADVVTAFANYLGKSKRADDPEEILRSHLTCEGDQVGMKVRIVLVSADFGQEVTTAVLWLNRSGLDIRCVRMVPYEDGNIVYLDVQQIIPVPEASDYLVKLRQKEESNEVMRRDGRDLTPFVVIHGGIRTAPLPKRRAMLEIVRILIGKGNSPAVLQDEIFQQNRFLVVDGIVHTEADFLRVHVKALKEGSAVSTGRYFTADADLLHHGGHTYAFSHQWGSKTRDTMKHLLDRYPDLDISIEECP